MIISFFIAFIELCPNFVGQTLFQFTRCNNNLLDALSFFDEIKQFFAPRVTNSTTHLTLVYSLSKSDLVLIKTNIVDSEWRREIKK
jgi:hypothetical protein